ncbi:hypothetical protein [Psychrobacillus sp. NPDC096623]|uniref:hypothetical protein n=1 Tax=Psychrobacillus sp. NPDC096623 TaxID=3364492 RepID=UPI00381697F6
MTKEALLVIDVENAMFQEGEEVFNWDKLLRNLNDLLTRARSMDLYKVDLIDWRARRRLQWEQREPKTPQESRDEEIKAVPTESVRRSGNQLHSDFTTKYVFMKSSK